MRSRRYVVALSMHALFSLGCVELGCKYAPGYFFSKPVIAAEAPHTLARFDGA